MQITVLTSVNTLELKEVLNSLTLFILIINSYVYFSHMKNAVLAWDITQKLVGE